MTQAQYKALMARRQQLLNKTSDISGNENLLLNKQERRVTFENDTQKAIIEPNTAEVIENNVSQNIQKNFEPPKAVPNNVIQNTPKSLKTEEITNKVASNYEFLMNQQKAIITDLNSRIGRLEKQLETQMSRHELKNSKNEEMIVTLNTTINNLSEILRNNFTKMSPPTLDAELQTEKQENEKLLVQPEQQAEPVQAELVQPEPVQHEQQPEQQAQQQPEQQAQPVQENKDPQQEESINVKLETDDENVNIKLEINNN